MKRRPGFTLIELLVVIAAISLIAVILFPGVARAGEKVRREECSDNAKPMMSALAVAARKGDVKQVRFLLAHSAAINARDTNGRTPLMDIAQQGNLPMMTLLTAKGANVNLQDKTGQTVLKLVLSGPETEGDTPVSTAVELQEISLLLNHGADVNAKDKDGDTVLIMAVIGEPPVVVEALVAHGADVNPHGSKKQTALMMAAAFYEGQAAYNGHGERSLQLLLSHSAEVNAKDAHGATALFYGTTDQYGTAAIWDVSWSDSEGEKSLADILKEIPGQSEGQEIEAARLLLAHGADVNARDGNGKTVLFYAKSENHPELAAVLEKAGGTE